MSVRNLIMMRPCVVSRTSVFCGSSPAGSGWAGWAEAEAAHIIANSRARTRVITIPLKLFNNDGTFLVFAPGKMGLPGAYREQTCFPRTYALALAWGMPFDDGDIK